MKKLYIVGCGMGQEKLLTSKAKEIIFNCKQVFAFDRICYLYKNFRNDIQKCTCENIEKLINGSGHAEIAVLLSGDTGFYSLANNLICKFQDSHEIEIIAGINSMQYMCSKLKISYENIESVSLHGREICILGYLSFNKYTFALTGGKNKAGEILRSLNIPELSDIIVYAGENFSMDDERILSGTINELSEYEFKDLTVLLFENPNPANKDTPIFDLQLIREKTPMTKQEVRWTSVNYLSVLKEETVFDIGAGTGSVALEMAKKAYNGVVYAIEKNTDACKLIEKNKINTKVYNVLVKNGNAKEIIKELPVPDKVFLGGTSGELSETLQYLHYKNSKIKFVLNAITMETLTEAVKIFKEMKFKTNISCINIAKDKPVGNHTLMMANNPVYVLEGEYDG